MPPSKAASAQKVELARQTNPPRLTDLLPYTGGERRFRFVEWGGGIAVLSIPSSSLCWKNRQNLLSGLNRLFGLDQL